MNYEELEIVKPHMNDKGYEIDQIAEEGVRIRRKDWHEGDYLVYNGYCWMACFDGYKMLYTLTPEDLRERWEKC